MGQMFSQLWTAITVFFMAFEKLASSVNNLATVAEETSAQYVDETRAQRQMKLNSLKKEVKASKEA